MHVSAIEFQHMSLFVGLFARGKGRANLQSWHGFGADIRQADKSECGSESGVCSTQRFDVKFRLAALRDVAGETRTLG